MKAIRVHATGGPETLQLDDVPEPSPRPGEAIVQVEAAGVNFIDIYLRTGLYATPPLPFILGQEAAGVVTAIGEGVSEVRPGDRVAYSGVTGAYAQFAAVPAARLVKLPDGVTTKQGAAAILQGMTAQYLTTSTYPLKAGDTCLVHAAAGGVGLLLCQIAKMKGARVIGTVSTEEKARLARAAGADEVVLYTTQDFQAEVKRLTDGKGVQVVYDSVARTTFEKSLNCLAPRGMLVLFGQSSGPAPPIDPLLLMQKGSLFLTRPSLNHYTLTREELVERASQVFGWIQQGKLRVHIGAEFPLKDAAAAHRALEGRQTTGKVLLIP